MIQNVVTSQYDFVPAVREKVKGREKTMSREEIKNMKLFEFFQSEYRVKETLVLGFNPLKQTLILC